MRLQITSDLVHQVAEGDVPSQKDVIDAARRGDSRPAEVWVARAVFARCLKLARQRRGVLAWVKRAIRKDADLNDAREAAAAMLARVAVSLDVSGATSG